METRNCQNCKKDFTIEPDDFSFYEKIKVPPPTWCPDCRTIRRFRFRNERSWHRRVCDATGKPVLSIFRSDAPHKVYEHNYWKSDEWDPQDYCQEYDLSRPFFEQFDELMKAVPHPNLIQKNNVNSDYTNATLNLKNCYFCASTDTAEDSAYLFNAIIRAKNCFDLHQSGDCEFCYELVDCMKSNRLFFGQNCEACVESSLMYDCKNCQNCFGCVGLRNKSYCIYNEQYSRESYLEKMKELMDGSYENLLKAKEKFEALKLTVPRKYAVINKSINVSGDDILEARNCKHVFSVRTNVENCKYSFRVWENSKDGMDAFVAWKGAELFYEVMSVTAQRVYFSAYIWSGFDIFYSYNCFDCNNIFGCVSLRNKSYCILNKQYSKEEYEKILPKIIEAMTKGGEYGEFFPPALSPFPYNDTIAQDYFPKTKEEIIALSDRFEESDVKDYKITISTEDIADSIVGVSSALLNEVIECAHKGECNEQCATAFRITENELQFYRTMMLPLPRLCPSCRHYARVKSKTPMKLWNRSCMKEGCANKFETPYAPDRPEIIYCEKCYQQEVY